MFIISVKGNLYLSEDIQKKEKEFLKIDFTWNENEKIILTGDSGSGKSLFFRILTGLHRTNYIKIQTPQSKNNAKALQSFHMRSSYLSQNLPSFDQNVLLFLFYPVIYRWKSAEKLFGSKTAFEKLQLIINPLSRLNKPPFRLLYKKACFYVNYFGFSENLFQKNLNSLSGGELFFIRFLRQVLIKKKIFLIDESHNQLDSKKRKIFFQFISRHSISFILITHVNPNGLKWDKIIKIENGSLFSKSHKHNPLKNAPSSFKE